MDIRMICMDLDGTALQNDRCHFSPRLIRALEQAHRKGIAVVPVTGRQYALLPPILLQHPVWEGYGVLCNGGQIRDLRSAEILHHLTISPEALKKVLQISEKYGLPLEFSIDSTLHLTEKSLRAQRSWPEYQFRLSTVLVTNGRIVEDLRPLCSEPVEKINLLCIPPQLHDALEEEMSRLPVSAVWTSAVGMEITHPDATKGNALQQLSRLLEIPMANIMALGDSGNDESMLRTAGFGVAMGNAPDYLKELADAVTKTNDLDGAAIAIETYALRQ